MPCGAQKVWFITWATRCIRTDLDGSVVHDAGHTLTLQSSNITGAVKLVCGAERRMQATKADKHPPPTRLVTLLKHAACAVTYPDTQCRRGTGPVLCKGMQGTHMGQYLQLPCQAPWMMAGPACQLLAARAAAPR
jgi:hypothetical protein